METKIIVIGNSKGVRLPKQALRECRLKAGETVRLDVRGRSIVITPKKNPREGWAESFRRSPSRRPENLWGDVPIGEQWER
jgi:antitoxin component of MazEF toxin-antitoxin module